jgi:hypothetical protein
LFISKKLGSNIILVTHGAMIIRAPGIGSEDSSTVSGTFAKKPLIWASKSSRMSVYHEPALVAGLVFVSVFVSIFLIYIGIPCTVQYAVGSSEL